MAAVIVVALAACGAGDDEDTSSAVTTDVVSNESTREMLVFAPNEEGQWPVVFLFHGLDGSASDMAELGERLAGEGVVVFAPTYSTDISTDEAFVRLARDAECSYRFARSIAADYGGDLSQPLTYAGWSFGANVAVQGGLDEEIDPTGQYLSCYDEVPRGDVIVAISGCYYEYQGAPAGILDRSEWANEDAQIVLIAGEEDPSCGAGQTEDLAAELRGDGYDVEENVLEGADHVAPIFHRLEGNTMVAAPDEPAGQRTVDIIVDAIAHAQQGDEADRS